MTKITFLGTGTSHGVPVIGCDCKVCKSTDPHDKRFRSSILVEKEGTSLVIDTGYEFRLQCLRANVKRLDCVLYTHAHSDHLMGLDDLRVFTKNDRLPVYSFKHVLDDVERKFPYAFANCPGVGLPQLDRIDLEPYEETFVKSISFFPIPVMHGENEIAGYRFGNAAYITDVSDILIEENRSYLESLDVLIIGALRERTHATHYSYKEAASVVRELKPKSAYFTHMNHECSHKEVLERYSSIALPAYDGLVLEVES